MSFHHLPGVDGRIERRGFLGALAPLAAAAPLWTGRAEAHAAAHRAGVAHAHAPAAEPAWRRRGHIPIFDAHLHIPSDGGPHWQVHPVTAAVAPFVAYLEHCGVGRGVVNAVRSQVATSAAEMIAGNREVLRLRDRKPVLLVPACIVMPQYLDESLRELEDWRTKYGAVWVGELCNYVSGFHYDTPGFAAIMKKVAELRMVIQIHATNDEMAHLVRTYPEATMVFPHMGAGARFEQRVDLVAGHRKACLEIAASSHDLVGGIEYAVRKIGADRVLFGSDFSINDPSGIIAVLDDARISEADREKVFHRNVERLLKEAGYTLPA
jgi:predicted TIM-barrel fold metal-dependent hydrolase